MPLLMRFSVSMQQFGTGEGNPEIQFLPKVNEYLSLIMTLIFAFGICFQMPVILTLLGKAGIIDSQFLVEKRRYAIVIVFVIAAVLTPPDVISQLALAIPTLAPLRGLDLVRCAWSRRSARRSGRQAPRPSRAVSCPALCRASRSGITPAPPQAGWPGQARP